MDLYSQYISGQLPHIHCSDDHDANIFNDALRIQYKRILANLQKQFPEKTQQEIKKMIFSDVALDEE